MKLGNKDIYKALADSEHCHQKNIETLYRVVSESTKWAAKEIKWGGDAISTDLMVLEMADSNDQAIASGSKNALFVCSVFRDVYQKLSVCLEKSAPHFIESYASMVAKPTTVNYARAIVGLHLAYLNKYKYLIDPNYHAASFEESIFDKSYKISLVIAAPLFLLSKKFFINPIIKKLFPYQWYQSTPIERQLNYSLLADEQLLTLKNALVKNMKVMKPYAERNKTLNKLAHLSAFTLGFYLMLTEGILTEGKDTFIKLFLPLFLMMQGMQFVMNQALLARERYLTDRNLAREQKQLQTIFSDVLPSLRITLFQQKNRALSCLSVKTIASQEPLSVSQISDMLKLTLYHFHISLQMDYSRTYFYLSGSSTFKNPAAMKDFFQKLLKNVGDIRLLDKQMENILTHLADRIHLQSEKITEINEADLYQRRWNIFTADENIFSMLQPYGFIKTDEGYTLVRSQPFANTSTLISDIKSSERKINSSSLSLTASKFVPVKKGKQKSYQPNNTVAEIKDHQESIPQSIEWPLSGVRYPGQAESVQNAKNCYLFWNLKLDAFGNDKVAHDSFFNKRLQMARSAKDEQGIKYGSYYGTDYYTNQQRFYPARIKVLGDNQGDNAVLLDIEQLENRRLLTTRGFVRGIHN